MTDVKPDQLWWRQTNAWVLPRGLATPRVKFAVELTLVVLLAMQTGHIGYTLWEAAPSDVGAAAPGPRLSVDRSILTRFDAFSPPPSGSEDVVIGGGDSPLRLFGVQVEGDRSVAIIGGADGQQMSVAVGEPVEPGLVLRSVAVDHVVLARGPVTIRLAFGDPAPAATAAPRSSGQRAISPAQPAPPRAVGGRVFRAPPGAGQSPAAATIDPAALMAQTTLRPRLQGLGVNGFTVTAKDDGTALRAAGLQSGDIILSVNGTELNSLDAARQLGEQLKSAASAEIRYQRNGQIRSTHVRAGS